MLTLCVEMKGLVSVDMFQLCLICLRGIPPDLPPQKQLLQLMHIFIDIFAPDADKILYRMWPAEILYVKLGPF